MSYDDEVKRLIADTVRQTLESRHEYVGMRMPHGDYIDEFMNEIADRVHNAIWEYIKDDS